MNVGDYVRTPKGIGRINQMYSDRKDSYIYLDCGITIDYITKDFTEEEINKMYPSSPNIIELLEENDLLKIEYYAPRYKKRLTRIFEVEYKDKKYMTLKNSHCDFMLRYNEFYDDDKKKKPIIKKILIHEQFESGAYRVEE